MLKKKRDLILIISFLFIIAEIFLLGLQGQTIKKSDVADNISRTLDIKKEDLLAIKRTYPVINYSSKLLSKEDKEKSKKYDNGIQVIFSYISKDEETLSTLPWERDLTALPIEESDMVLIGKVTDAKAILSASKKSVFSEFKVEIENVLKNTKQQKLENATFVKVEREGGVVRYPSGYENWYRVAGQQMPNIGSKYVFFLTNDFPLLGHYENDLYILTAYELKEGKVIALDNPDDSHPIVSTYKDKEEIVLLNDLQNSLKSR